LAGKETMDFLLKFHEARSRFHEQVVKLKGYEQPVTAWGLQFEELGDVLKAADALRTLEVSDRTGIYFPPRI
jgi:hypothetical protein